jgi:iron complex transport system ATP-binding protein
MFAGSLALSSIRIKRTGRVILDIDNLTIESGEFVGIIGTNGAGKTTLLKLCCGLFRPNQGVVTFDDINFTHLNPWRKTCLRRYIGYIPQSAEYNPDLPFTLREVVAMGRTSAKPLLKGLNRQDYEIVDHWIDKLGLNELANQTFRSLSGGEQQKTLIARAMAQNAKILLFDEPCSSLDFNWSYQITQVIEKLYHSAEVTILMVSHQSNQLPDSCRRVILLHKGRIVADGLPDNVLSSEAFEQAYGCRAEILRVAGRRYTINKK